MRKAWQAMVAGEDPRDAFSTGVFGIWAGSAEVQPLISYLGDVAHSDRPLELAGFDSQFSAMGSRTYLMADLREWVGDGSAAGPRSDRRLWAQMLKSIATQAEGVLNSDIENLTPESAAFRDEQMGDNLVWLADEWYRGRKIVVWAATLHNVRNIGTIDSQHVDYTKVVTVGQIVWEAMGDEVYNLGFTAFEEEYARGNTPSARTLGPPTKGSLEDLMNRAGLQDAIVDFRGAGPALSWLAQPMVSKPLGHSEMEADWTQVLDGMFLNRVLERSTRAEPPAPGGTATGIR